MRYATLPHQLELAFDGKFEHCPSCNPSGNPERDLFRPMCGRHFREHEASLDKEAFLRDIDAALERGRRDVELYLATRG